MTKPVKVINTLNQQKGNQFNDLTNSNIIKQIHSIVNMNILCVVLYVYRLSGGYRCAKTHGLGRLQGRERRGFTFSCGKQHLSL